MPTVAPPQLPQHFDWTTGVVAIMKGSRPAGTGFVVAGDAGTPLIVTCAHVLRDAGWAAPAWDESVALKFKGSSGAAARARAVPVAAWYRAAMAEDVAVLRLQGDLPAGVTPLPLATARGSAGRGVRTFGYPDIGDYESLSATGAILAPVTTRGGYQRLQLRSAEITHGYSGAPLWDEAGARVLGVIHSGIGADKMGRHQHTAFAIPADVLAAICDEVQLRAPAVSGQPLYGVPDLPPSFQSHPDALTAIEALLLDVAARPAASNKIVGLQGMGGSGKSVMAAALVRQDKVRAAFPDGIFWLTVGQAPDLVGLQAELGRALGHTAVGFAAPGEGEAALRGWLRGRRCLLILDDVWQRDHAARLQVHDAAASACLLLTTRHGALLRQLNAAAHELALLPPAQALALLAEQAGQPVAATQTDDQARAVVAACGRLPLALAMMGAMVRGRPEPWARALAYLAKQDLGRIRQQFPDYPHPNLLQALAASVAALDQAGLAQLEPRARYLDLAIFPKSTPIPLATLAVYWSALNLDFLDVQDLVDLWVDLSLARLSAAGHLILHDLQVDYVRQLAGDLQARQRQLLAGYQAAGAGTWAEGPDDGYYFDQLTYHLRAAGRGEELATLLTTYTWLATQLRRAGAAGLLRDFERADGDETAESVARLRPALRLDAALLTARPEQLPGRLLGRFLDVTDTDQWPRLTRLLAQAEAAAQPPWLRPRRASLNVPGGALLANLTGHSQRVNAVAVTPDGRLAVSAASDNTLIVWDVATGTRRHTLTGHTDAVTDVAVTPDGRLAVSAAYDEQVKVWDLAQGQLQHTLAGHTDVVEAVAVTPDGRLAVSGAVDNSVKVWDLATGTLRFDFSAHTSYVWDVAVTADGQRAVSASHDGTLKVWDLVQGQLLFDLSAHTEPVRSVAVTADGQTAVSASNDGTVRVWALPDGSLRHTLTGHTSHVTALAVTPDGRHAVSGATDGDGRLKVWDLVAGQPRHDLQVRAWEVIALAITADGSRTVSSFSAMGQDSDLKVWDLNAGERLYDLAGHSQDVVAIALTGDGQTAISAGLDATLKVWNLTAAAPAPSRIGYRDWVEAVALALDGPRPPNPFHDHQRHFQDQAVRRIVAELAAYDGRFYAGAVTPDGRLALSVYRLDDTINVWDLAQGELAFELRGHENWVTAVAVTSDGQRAVSASGDATLKVWDLGDGQLVHTLTGHQQVVNGVAISADGRLAVSAAKDTTLKVWDPTTGELQHTLTGHSDGVSDVTIVPGTDYAISSDGTFTSQAYDLKVWDLASGELAYDLLDHQGPFRAAACAADERHVVAASGRNSQHGLKVWDLASGALRHTLSGPTDRINVVALTPNGQHVVAGVDDGTLWIWDVDTGAGRHRLRGHRPAVTAAVVTPDSRFLVSAARTGGTIKVWDVARGELVADYTLDDAIHSVTVAADGRTVLAATPVLGLHQLALVLAQS